MSSASKRDMGSVRLFCSSAVRLKVSSAAKALDKIIHGNAKRKPWYTQGNQLVPELFGKPQIGNRKVANRRVQVLNAVFHERITDLLSSSEIDPTLQDHGFLVTKVKYSSDGSAVHVYWNADANIKELTQKLPRVAGKLRHTLTQLQLCGHVPHINFILEKSLFRAVDVEELLATADYGPDFVSSAQRMPILETFMKDSEDLTKTTNVLGVDRDAIMNQIIKSMKQIKEKSDVAQTSNEVSFQERRVNFKKFLKLRAVKVRSKRQQELATYVEADYSEDDNDVPWENDDYIDYELKDGSLK